MGLLDNQIQSQYYSGNNFGDYQFTTLDNIINAFMFTYVGESKIINKVNRTDVQFHAMRAVQELSYDVFRSIKTQEIEVPATLIMPLPHDYVNYVKLSKVDSDGVERVLYPTGKTSNPFAIEQVNGVYQFEDNNILNEQGSTSLESNTWTSFQNQANPSDEDVSQATDVEYDNRGRRYGLDPQYAQANGTFFIDYRKGYIHFGASLNGDTIVLRYISDGLGTDAEMVVHKFAEEAVYKSIAYGVLSTRSNVPEYIVARFKKERFAETRKAKIRLSNIKIEEFAQVIKGMGKQIK
tara:strand:- start:821 stop:1702 length:882 start_codon:yes stop_codon:yes gene_type:complete